MLHAYHLSTIRLEIINNMQNTSIDHHKNENDKTIHLL